QRERRGGALADGAAQPTSRHHLRDGHARPARRREGAPPRAPREGPARGRAVTFSREIARQAPPVARPPRRNPRRTALTFLGLVISFFLFTSLESLLYTMSNIVSGASRDALLFTRAADPDYWRAQLPASYAAAIEELPGVVAASPVRVLFGAG